MEHWRQHPDFLYLMVSSKARFMRADTGEFLTPCRNGKYRAVNTMGRTHSVHVTVLEAFVGPRPDGHVACHGPQGRDDNTLENLYWGTCSRNWHDQVRDGTAGYGLQSPNGRLSDEQVLDIYYSDLTPAAAAAEYGIVEHYAYQIMRGTAPRIRRILKEKTQVSSTPSPDSMVG